MLKNVLTKAGDTDLAKPSDSSECGNSARPETAQVKNRVLAAIVSRIESRDTKVDTGATLYGFAKFSKC